MSTNELNIFLNGFQQPEQFPSEAWNRVLIQAREVWESYRAGNDWQQKVEIPCKEAYLMLVDRHGKLIVQNESLLNYVKTKQVNSWRKRLEEIAFKAIRDKRYDKAERYFSKAIKVDGGSALNFYRRGLVQMKQLNHKKALDDFSKAISLNPNVSAFYLKRYHVYRLLDVDYKAMSDLNMAIKVNSMSAEAFELRGKFRLSLGDNAGGKMDLIRSKELRDKGVTGGEEHYESQAA